MTQQILKPSKKLIQLIAEFAPDFGKLETKKDAVFEQGRTEGFSDMEIGDLVRSKMKEHYSDRTIRRILPDTAKHTKHVSEHKTQPDILSGSGREPIEVPPDKVKVEPTNKTLPQPEERTVEGIENEPVSIDAPKTADVQEKSEPRMQQPIAAANHPIEQPGPKEVNTSNFSIDKLETYPLDYCKEVIRVRLLQ